MQRAEFDKVADEYRALHAHNLCASGEAPEYFAEYKVRDLANLLEREGSGAPASILDFGAGVGNSTAFLRGYFPASRIVGADPSPRSLEIAVERHPEECFVQFDGRRLPFPDGAFDCVFVACVLHHVAPAQHSEILVELRRVLRPGGILFVYEHNPLNFLTVRAVRTCPFDENAFLVPAREMLDAFRRSGFAQPAIRYRVFFPHALRGLRWLEPALFWLMLGAQYCAYARK